MQTHYNRISGYEPKKDSQETALIKLVVKSFKGKRLDSMECARLARSQYGLIIDWHEFAYMLDNMTRTGESRFICFGKDHFSVYEIL